MNRHYSLFSSRAKVRREKFASTRNSLSESWEQTFPLDESAASFIALPSPTIGGESGIPERLSLALCPLARREHHHSTQNAHHHCLTSMMMSSGIGAAKTSSISTTSVVSSTSSSSSVSAASCGGGGGASSFFKLGKKSSNPISAEGRAQQQHQQLASHDKAQPKWSPRLQIVRQLSQPVLRTAEIVDTRQGKGTISSTGCTTTSPAAAATSPRYLGKQGASSRSYDWNRDVSTQCNIFQFPQPSTDMEQEDFDNHHYGPPRTKSARLKNFRRCRSYDWDHFRKCMVDSPPWELDQKLSQTYSGSCTNASFAAPAPFSPTVHSAAGAAREEGGSSRPKLMADPRSCANRSKTCLIKNTGSADPLPTHVSASSSPLSSRGFQVGSISSISYSPPISPRKFAGLRAAMPSIFTFSKEKVMRRKEPPTHLDLFGTPGGAVVGAGSTTTPYSEPLVETTVCKKCALLLPGLTGSDEKPELMQQQTQTEFSMGDFTPQQELAPGSGSSIDTTAATTTSPSTKSDTYSTNRVAKSTTSSTCTSIPSTIVVSGANTQSSSPMYVCQAHQAKLVQQKQGTAEPAAPAPVMVMPVEKKYVPSPLAAEKWNKNSTQNREQQHVPESPVLSGSGSTASAIIPSHSHFHQQNHHHHHHHHHHQPPKKHSLAFSLPIPQVAMQYANIPSGDPTPCHPACSQRSPFDSAAANSKSCSAAAAATFSSSSDSTAAAAEGRGKSSTLPTIDSKHIVAIRSAEKRRRFFAKKQTNSAPDTFDSHTFLNATQGVLHTTRRLCGNCKEPVTNCLDGVLRATRREKGDTSSITPPSVEVWESEIRTARCGNVAVTHVSELDFENADPPCHFCCEQASTAIHDASRLQIVSGGLVRSRDGSARSGSAPYINLPSPNVQAENGQQSVFPSLELSPSMSQTLSPGSHYDHPANVERSSPPTRGGSLAGTCGSRSSIAGSKEEEDPLVGPPASSLTRRPALVPPKLIPDPDYENDLERDRNSCRNSDDNTSPRARRSSIVVIPPMQICPGDLLVYGKCLSQRKSLLGTTIETPSPITNMNMLESENTTSRKGKATWSLLKLFERGSRPKGGPSGAIEEIMSLIQPCDYSDPKLTRFKGMCWSDFVSHVANQKVKKTGSCGSVTSGSSSEGSQSNQPLTGTPLTKAPKDQGKEGELLSDNQSICSEGGGSGDGAVLVLGHPTLSSTPSAPTPSTTGSSVIASISLLKDEKAASTTRSPKPLVRKRMGLMRTMSDRCLERRAPALFRGREQGFLMGEKLVEGKETEPTGDSTSSKVGKPFPLNPMKSEKDLLASSTANKETVLGSTTGSVSTSGPLQHQPPPEESISDPDLRQKMRQKEALWDLFQSECSFLYDHLMVLKNVFLEPLKRIQVEGIAMYAEPELLFGNLDELCGVTYAFCKEFIHLLLKLTDAAGELSTTEVLAKLFEPSSKARTMSQAYHRYALNYINALNYLETLRRQVEFTEFEKLCMKDPRCKKLQLTDLLVSPVQHIMKVPLILKDIQCRTNEPQEKELILQILEIQESSIRELDDKMRWLKNYERLLEIQRNIVWPSILEMEPKTWVPEFLKGALLRQPCDSIIVSPRRQIIHEGLLQLWDTGKPTEAYVILFDDMLLITRRKKGLSKKKSSLTENWQSACGKSGSVMGSGLETNHRYIVYRQPISLDRFFIHDIAEAENTSAKLDYAFVLVALNRFQQIVAVHTFQAPADQVKNLWLLKLKTTQEKWKRTLQTTVFRGVRSSTDSGQSNVASSLVFGLNKQFMRHNEA